MSGENQAPIRFDTEAAHVVACKCEFCGRPYWIDTQQYALAHEMPYCAEFQAMDVITFMSENNKIKMRKQSGRPSA